MFKFKGEMIARSLSKKVASKHAENNLLRQHLAIVDVICGETKGTRRDQIMLHLRVFKRQKKKVDLLAVRRLACFAHARTVTLFSCEVLIPLNECDRLCSDHLEAARNMG